MKLNYYLSYILIVYGYWCHGYKCGFVHTFGCVYYSMFRNYKYIMCITVQIKQNYIIIIYDVYKKYIPHARIGVNSIGVIGCVTIIYENLFALLNVPI